MRGSYEIGNKKFFSVKDISNTIAGIVTGNAASQRYTSSIKKYCISFPMHEMDNTSNCTRFHCG